MTLKLSWNGPSNRWILNGFKFCLAISHKVLKIWGTILALKCFQCLHCPDHKIRTKHLNFIKLYCIWGGKHTKASQRVSSNIKNLTFNAKNVQVSCLVRFSEKRSISTWRLCGRWKWTLILTCSFSFESLLEANMPMH